MTTQERFAFVKEIGLALVMFSLFVFGLAASVGSLNWAIRGEGDWIFIAGSIVGLVDAVYTGYSFYAHFLKSDKSVTRNAKQ